jgi:hypothetical protein
MIQWEEVELKDATHIEINGCVVEMKEKDGIVERSADFSCINILVGGNKWVQIPLEAFFALGIRCLRKFKPKPIEFIYTVGCGIAPPDEWYGRTWRCIEILEDEE